MRRIFPTVLLGLLSSFGHVGSASAQQPGPLNPTPAQNTRPQATLTVPAGTKVMLALTSPVWAETAKLGDSIYASSTFPVAVGGVMAIPPGTYLEGKIDAMIKPGFLSDKAEFQLHFSKLVFANGYTVVLPGSSTSAADPITQTPTDTQSAISAATQTAVASVYVEVSRRSDILLDSGSQFEMTLQSPLTLDAASVSSAAQHARPPQLGPYVSSSRCVPTAGTPGTPDTVIPGTPGTPGTPDTVIPGGPGMPPTVIPGIPPTPGTPPTIIHGSPGTPGTSCPGPPVVLSQPNSGDKHTRSFQLDDAAVISGTPLAKGKYQISWEGLGPTALVDIRQKDKLVLRVNAHVVALGEKASKNQSIVRANAGGSPSVSSLQFKGEALAISFD